MGYKVVLQFSLWFSHYSIRFSILLRNEYCEKFQQNLMPCPLTGPKMFCAGTKNNITECKSYFCLTQNVCDCHNMSINVWSGTKNLDQPQSFWDLLKDKALDCIETIAIIQCSSYAYC